MRQIPPPFTTMDEVKEYLNDDRIQCLLCDRLYARLTYTHLNMHGITADEYREQFGIPYNRSLTGTISRENSRRMNSEVNFEALKKAWERPRKKAAKARKGCPAVRNQWRTIVTMGHDFHSRLRVTVPCRVCGVAVETTALTACQPVRCENCTTRGARNARRSYWRKKALALGNQQSTSNQ